MSGAAPPGKPGPADTFPGSQPGSEPSTADLLTAVPGIARIAATAWLHSTEWAVMATLHAYARLARAAVSGDAPGEILDQLGGDLREQLRRLLGVIDPDDRLRTTAASAGARASGGDRGAASRNGSPPDLRERGTELLRRSADVTYEEEAHPAYMRILDDMAPDEARILRLLCLEGPQPAVDVRSRQALSPTSDLVAPGLSMIGAHAGCRYPDRIPAYLNNLFRLGLIWFSREALADTHRYQVLEAQPDVLEALRQPGRGRTRRRSIQLTPFGRDFCAVCLPVDVTGEMEAVVQSPAVGGAATATLRPPEPDAPRVTG